MRPHEVAVEGFGAGADDYEASRPSYPPDLVAWFAEHLRIGPGARVADVAAGTGKLTRLLVPLGGDVLAVEPVGGMLAAFGTAVPGVPAVAAVAEALPLRAGALDAVTVAQAFHWFDAARAAGEFRRVLRPGGRVGLVWNARDRREAWVDEIWSIMDRVERAAPWRDHQRGSGAAVDLPGFGPPAGATFRHVQRTTPEGVLRRIASVSHVAVLPAAARAAVLDEVRGVLDRHPATRGRAEVEIPYRVDAWWAERP